MADGIIRRWVRVLLDRASAKQTGDQLTQAIGEAGKKSGDNFVRNLKASFAKQMADLKVLLAKGIIDEKEFKKRGEAVAKQFNKGLIEGMQKAQKEGRLTDKEFVKLAGSLKRTGDEGASAGNRIGASFAKLGAAVAATFTLDKALTFFRQSIAAALEAEESVSRLNAVLKPLGLNYRTVGREVERYLDRIQATTKFSDEDAREALTFLVTATGDYRESLQLLDVTAKIAEKRQISMAEAARVAADASKGITKGMRDLGIATGETGNIVEKIGRNLGNIAEEAGGTNAGKIQRAANLWGEFQENIGLALLNSEAFQDSSEGMIGVLERLNTWAKDSSDSIGGTATAVATLLTNLIRLGVWIVDHTPNIVTFNRVFFSGDGKDAGGLPTADPIVVTGPSGKPTGRRSGSGTPAKRGGGVDDPLARERVRLAREIRVATLMVEQQITKDFAEELVRREELLGNHKTVIVGSVEEGLQKLDQLNLILAAGMGGELIPKVKQTEQVVRDMAPAVDNMASAVERANEKMANDAAFAAELYKTPWIDAMGAIRAEVEADFGLFAELGQAWAHGGFAGIVELAKYKVKENLARVIEELAKAAGSFALGNPAAATAHLKSAAGHGAAAIAWKALSKTGGSGGGASGSGSSGGGPNLSSAQGLKPADSEVHIYLDAAGFDATNPVVQKVVMGSIEAGKERYGNNVKVHRGSR